MDLNRGLDARAPYPKFGANYCWSSLIRGNEISMTMFWTYIEKGVNSEQNPCATGFLTSFYFFRGSLFQFFLAHCVLNFQTAVVYVHISYIQFWSFLRVTLSILPHSHTFDRPIFKIFGGFENLRNSREAKALCSLIFNLCLFRLLKEA